MIILPSLFLAQTVLNVLQNVLLQCIQYFMLKIVNSLSVYSKLSHEALHSVRDENKFSKDLLVDQILMAVT